MRVFLFYFVVRIIIPLICFGRKLAVGPKYKPLVNMTIEIEKYDELVRELRTKRKQISNFLKEYKRYRKYFQ